MKEHEHEDDDERSNSLHRGPRGARFVQSRVYIEGGGEAGGMVGFRAREGGERQAGSRNFAVRIGFLTQGSGRPVMVLRGMIRSKQSECVRACVCLCIF